MVAIFVALMFVGLVLIDLCLAKWRERRALTTGRPVLAAGADGTGRFFGFDLPVPLPEAVHLSSAHTWFKPDPTGGLEVGADALIAHAVGDVRKVILPGTGCEVAAGQPLFTLECDGYSLTIPSTITGRVLAVNTRLQDQPDLISSEPYAGGWICYVTPTRTAEGAHGLRFGEKALMWLDNEFARFREFISAQTPPELALGATSQDGGFPAFGCLNGRNPIVWKAFETEFLRPNTEAAAGQ